MEKIPQSNCPPDGGGHPPAGPAEEIFRLNEQYFRRYGQRRLACVRTYGCQQNVSDSEKIRGQLGGMGYGLTENPDGADLVIFNTCAVREHAEQRVFGNVGALKNLKEQKPSMVIALCGCMMQQEHIVEKIRKSYPYVDLVFGVNQIHRLPEYLNELFSGGGRVFGPLEDDASIVEGLPVSREGAVRAFLPVMYGCDNFCSYCIVPYVRGRERSREPGPVLKEAAELIGQGYKEIMLLGQNVNSYGKGLRGGWDFPRLLREVAALPGDFRVTFMTSHPRDAGPALFEAMRDSPRVARHLHLPFQSGSSRVLKAMNRGYTAGQYRELALRAKETIPGLSLTSDVIVGFPGETAEDFEQTLELVREVRFSNLFTFIYSPRKGTPAEKLEDPVPRSEKTKWMSELLALQQRVAQELLEEKLHKTFRVLAEGPAKTGPGLAGRTDDGSMVDFMGPPALKGRFVQVKITEISDFTLLGEISPQ